MRARARGGEWWRGRGRRLARGLAVLAALLCPAGARAQQPTPPPRPPLNEQQRTQVLQALQGLDLDTASVRSDTLPGDTLPPDSLRSDSVRVRADTTAPLLPALPRDSVSRLLLGLPGYQAVEYAGAAASYAADSARIELMGPGAQVTQAEQKLGADSMIVFSQTTNVVCGYGKPVMEGGGAAGSEPVKSQQVCYNTQRQVGVARGANTKFSEGADWYLRGDVYTKGSKRIYGSGEFTTCDLEVPHYSFVAKELKVVRDSVLVARNVTLNFADVPVMWLPFMLQSLKRGRRSGLLMPQFSINDIARTQKGWHRHISNVGFYWAINDYLGAQVTGDWFADNWTALEGDFDYRWLDQFLQGGLSVRRYWRQTSKDLTLSSRTGWQPNERTSVQASANYASSSDFIRQNTFDPTELTRSIDSNVGVNRRFDWGSLSLSGQRRQYLSDDRVDMTLPALNVNVASITLFSAPADRAHFYNNATISGSFGGQLHRLNQNEMLLNPAARDTRDFRGNLSTSFRMGSLSWSQNMTATQNVLFPKPAIPDTANPDSIALAALSRYAENDLQWSTSLSYTQRLIGTSSFSPNVQLSGQLLRSDTLGTGYISSPVRLSVGAGLQTDLYGFYPGFGPFSRFRHRISPGFSYSFSPGTKATTLQQEAFGASDLMEQNRLSLNLSQTFEAKYRETPGEAGSDTTAGAAADTLGADTLGTGPGALTGEPRRLPQSRKVILLSINTSAISYDFVRARSGQGLTTTQLTNTISSDFLHGLSLTMSHDLFRTTPGDSGWVAAPGRHFSPRLRSLSTSFSVNSGSWLFRKLGLSGGGEKGTRPGEEQAQDTTSAMQGQYPTGISGRDLGLVGRPGTEQQTRRPQGRTGTWNANLAYTLSRPPVGSAGSANQMIQANINFQPTESWNVYWRTGYSISDHHFTDHILSLTRDLHEWQASFNFVKAQNGNFQFTFRVQLTDLPDLHLDYDQRNTPVQPGGGF